MRIRLAICVVTTCYLLGCSRDVPTGTRCGDGHAGCGKPPNSVVDAADRSRAGSGAAGGTTVAVDPVAPNGNALAVQVENIQKMKIDLITLACAGDCADIAAVVRGGNPPYALSWEDGSTSAARHVCLDVSTGLSVSATDTAIGAVEFGYDAHTVRTEVTARVLDCNDAGLAGACPNQPACPPGKYSGKFAGANVMSGLEPAASDLPQSGLLTFTLVPASTNAGPCGNALDADELDLSDDASTSLGSLITASHARLSGKLDCATAAFEAKSIDGTWLLLGIEAGPFDTTLSGSLDPATGTISGKISCNAGARSMVGTFSATRTD